MTLRLGTRGSRLALWQAHWVRDSLLALDDPPEVEIVTVRTLGDEDQTSRLSEMGTTGVFTKALEDALLEERIDLAVHSLKDVETELAGGTRLGAFLPRADARDALLCRDAASLDDLPDGARVGTSSLRRTAWLKRVRPDLEIVPLRGNVPTRVARLEEGEMEAMVLATAGLTRLGMEEHITQRLDPHRFLPAPGQGIVAIQIRDGDEVTLSHVGRLDHAPSRAAALAERTFLNRLGGGCLLPVGAYAEVEGDSLRIHTGLASEDGTRWIEKRGESAPAGAVELGRRLADEMLAEGGREILDGVREPGGHVPPRS